MLNTKKKTRPIIDGIIKTYLLTCVAGAETVALGVMLAQDLCAQLGANMARQEGRSANFAIDDIIENTIDHA